MENILKYNITILGYSNVGKTSMISILNDENFDDSGLITVALDYSLKEIKIGNNKCIFKIYDTPGVESQKYVSASTINNAHGIILLYSVDDRTSFSEIDYWLKIIEERINKKKIAIIIVANKVDLDYRIISKEEGQKYAEDKGLKYFEISSKNEFNIKETFKVLFEDIYNLYSYIDLKNYKRSNIAYKNLKKKQYISLLMKYINK